MSTKEKKKVAGLEETLTIPQQHKDSASITMRVFDANFRTINGGLMSVAKNVGAMQGKLKKVEDTDKNVCDLQCRIQQLEKTATVHTTLLTDIFELLKRATAPDDEVAEEVVEEAEEKLAAATEHKHVHANEEPDDDEEEPEDDDDEEEPEDDEDDEDDEDIEFEDEEDA